MILAGLALGGYAFAAWPELRLRLRSRSRSTTVETPNPGASSPASVETAYPGDIFVYELPSTMLIDSIMATPQPVDAH